MNIGLTIYKFENTIPPQSLITDIKPNTYFNGSLFLLQTEVFKIQELIIRLQDYTNISTQSLRPLIRLFYFVMEEKNIEIKAALKKKKVIFGVFFLKKVGQSG